MPFYAFTTNQRNPLIVEAVDAVMSNMKHKVINMSDVNPDKQQNEAMGLISLLESDAAKLPRKSEGNFEEQLKSMFDSYLSVIDRLPANDDAIGKIKTERRKIIKLGDGISKALKYRLDGKQEKALKIFHESLGYVADEINLLSEDHLDSQEIGSLFRIRTGALNKEYGRGDLFHIPFQCRDRVETQRYSFPGLPCLYLGGSIYVCWLECGSPELSNIWASKFSLIGGKSMRVLDFGYTPKAIASMHKNPENLKNEENYEGLVALTVASAILWPLVAACSMKPRSDTQRGFVVEYVIPQLLWGWIIEQQHSESRKKIEKIDGIRYFSCHVNDELVGKIAMNYVFPARRRATEGYCAILKSKFELTPPINWQIATALEPTLPVNYKSWATLCFQPGYYQIYRNTVFAKVEYLLDSSQRESLDS